MNQQSLHQRSLEEALRKVADSMQLAVEEERDARASQDAQLESFRRDLEELHRCRAAELADVAAEERRALFCRRVQDLEGLAAFRDSAEPRLAQLEAVDAKLLAARAAESVSAQLEETIRELREDLRQRHDAHMDVVEQRSSEAHAGLRSFLQSESSKYAASLDLARGDAAARDAAVAAVSTAVEGLTAVEALVVRQQAQIDDVFSAVRVLRASLGTTLPTAPLQASDCSSSDKLSVLSGRFNDLEAKVRAVTDRFAGLQPGATFAAAAGGADSGAGAGVPIVPSRVPRVLRPAHEPTPAHFSRNSSPLPQHHGSSARLSGPPPSTTAVQPNLTGTLRLATPKSVMSPGAPPCPGRGFTGAGSPIGTPLVGCGTSFGMACQPSLRSPSGVGMPRVASQICPVPGAASPPTSSMATLPVTGPHGPGRCLAEMSSDDLYLNPVSVHAPAVTPPCVSGASHPSGHLSPGMRSPYGPPGACTGGMPRLAIGALGNTASPDPSPRTADGLPAPRGRTGLPSQGPCLTNLLHGRASGTRSPTPPGACIPGMSVWKVHG